MRWIVGMLPLGCVSVTDVDPAEGCRQAQIAVAETVWACTGDDRASIIADNSFEATYTCRVTGWAGEAELLSLTDPDLSLVRNVSVAPPSWAPAGTPPTVIGFEGTLACAEVIRAQDCALAAAPIDDGRLLTLAPCGDFLDAPRLGQVDGIDRDGDQVPYPLDCDDADPTVYPGAFDTCADGVDTDCDDTFEYDCDRDGSPQGEDCNDADPAVFPGNVDVCGDFVDTDCDPIPEYDCDLDGDGYRPGADGDCNDNDPTVYPGAEDTACDGVDRDCDQRDCCVVEGDCDGDGVPVDEDCNDDDPFTYPGAPDACHDGFEQDCGTVDDFDCDGDGWRYGSGYGYDCDDFDPDVNPAATELRYDKVDSNCNGQIDF